MHPRIPAAAFLLFVAIATGLSAQHPNSDRGFTPGRSFQVGDLDNVNLFNGNLVLTIPIGGSYPVGGGFSYGLTLTYNSNVWDFQEREVVPALVYTQALPGRTFNAGLGWTLSLGRLIDPLTDTSVDTERWVYLGPDGAEHRFYPTLHEGDPVNAGVSYSRDGSYLRMKELAAGIREVEFPDGTVHKFDAQQRLIEIRDRFNNWLAVDYGVDPETGEEYWTLRDSHQRSHRVQFTSWMQGKVRHRLVDWVDLVASPSSGGTATYDFNYSPATVPRACPDNDPETGDVEIRLLASLTLPDGSSYQMPDYAVDGGGMVCRSSGALKALRLPTLGRIEWTYQDYSFPVGNKKHQQKTMGVATRRLVDAAGAVQGTWTYATNGTVGLNPPNDVLINTVTDPLGHKAERYFSVFHVVDDYSLPFSRVAPGDGAGRFLSSRTYNVSGTLLRSTYVRYERDKNWTALPDDFQDRLNLNRRPGSERTVYHDDGNRFADVAYSEFDGLGHYRKSITGGNFGSGDVRTTTVDYNPGRGIYRIDPATEQPAPGHTFNMLPASSAWVLGTFASQKVEEGGSTATTLFCHNASTGFLQRKRTLKNNGTTENAADLLEAYTADASGNLISERFYGGDLQSITASHTTCSMVLPAPEYQIDHTYQKGVLATSQYSGVTFKTVERTVDASGLISQSKDSAGLATDFKYDAVARPTWSKPVGDEHGGGTETVYTPAQNANNLAQVLIRRRAGGEGSNVLAQSRITFDSFGRVWKEEQLLPGNVWSVKETEYNALGQKTSVSEVGAPAQKTLFLDYDPFGRPATIRPPDGNAHNVTLSYSGVRQVSRTTQVAVYEGGSVSEKSSTTTETYDRQGRLFRVAEPSGSGGTSTTTTYSYDIGNRLSQVSTPPQARTFTYDNRGFLVSETHPEKGGAVIYARYDSRGHAGRKTDGPNELSFLYDKAERLTDVKEGNLPLKRFTYATASNANEWGQGKLREASRFNYITLGGPITVEIRESYIYGGRDGRVSQRATVSSVNGGTNDDAFTQSFSYTPLGLPNQVTYPTCTNSGCTQASAPLFADVTTSRTEIEAIYRAGVTAGCGSNPLIYCPNTPVTRAQMAVFLLVAKEGTGYQPPACITPTFADVPCSDPFARWIEELVRRDITAGCEPNLYCPNNSITQEQMSVFLLTSKEPGISPPACVEPPYGDVPCSSPFARWIDEAKRRGITTGCGSGQFCPASPVTRGQMAGLLVRAFHIPVQVSPTTVRTAFHNYTQGLLTGVTDYASISYHSNLLINQVRHTNLATEAQGIASNAMRRPLTLSATSPRASWSSGTYTYDGAGNIKAIGNSWFGYDRVNRLTTGTVFDAPDGTGTSRQQTYSYDIFGNLTAIAGANGRSLPTSNTTNRLTGAGVVYDAAGNLTHWNGAVYEYDRFNQMTKMTSGAEDWRYIYTAEDERIWSFKLGSNFSRWTLRDLDAKVLREFENNAGVWSATSDYFYRNGLLLAAETDKGRRHYHLDHLGTPRLITDRFGYKTAYHVYFPFGEEATAFDQDTERMKFTGHERDLGSAVGVGDDLDYMHARHYSPVTGRFLSTDPSPRSIRFAMPQTWNRYVYVLGNSLKYIDPSGQAWFRIEGKWQFLQSQDQIETQSTDEDGNDVLTITVGRRRFVAFTGGSLILFDKDGRKTLYGAVSGRGSQTDPSLQRVKNLGPIPEGRYWFNTGSIQSFSSLSLTQKLASLIPPQVMKVGSWPGGQAAWGNQRVELTPDASTNTYGRTGIFIHGGFTPGSAGCIDLCDRDRDFFSSLGGAPDNITVEVDYP